MAQIFPKWSNRLPALLALSALAGLLLVTVGIDYFFSPEFTDVGYQPHQPVPFSHALHAGELEIDCRYCHTSVEISRVASVPPTQICMNCHRMVKTDSPKLARIRHSLEDKQPIHWIRVHNLPDYAYFDHGVHVRAGVGCASCHGDVTRMDEIRQVEPLSMSWCLDCHRNPAPSLRPLSQVTAPRWRPGPQEKPPAREVHPPTDCSACHR